ncbi:MAG: methyltransferase, partial [Euryarchaeota archaeon]|nr:methyltransferase [Euryarchaeota archaeon]
MGDIVPDNIEAYVDAHLAPRDSALAAVEEQGRRGWPIIGPAEGTLLQLLAKLVKAKRALELGTAIGYSGTWITRGLEPGGELVTVEWNSDTAKIASANLKKSGVADRVRIVGGSAL